MILNDPAAERAVIAGVLHYNASAYFDIADIISDNTFTIDSNAILFKCAKYAIEKDNDVRIDIPTIYSSAQELGLSHVYTKTEEVKHLHAVMSMPVQLANIRKFAGKIRKLEIARLLHGQLSVAQDRLVELRGDESITHILGIAEDSIFDFTSLLNDSDDEPELMGTGLAAYMQGLADNPVDCVGISTGYPVFDMAIGGGLRNGTVNMIGARPKALRYGEKVYTPNGIVNIEDIKVGDTVIHPFIGQTKVTGVHDHKNEKIYRVTFRDGDYIECGEDHLWEVTRRNYPKTFVKTTLELSKNLKVKAQEYKWDVRLCNPIQFTHQEVELDPYILGLLLGDGSFRNAITFHNTSDELLSVIKNMDYEVKEEKDDRVGACPSLRINGLQPIIRSLGLYKKKAKDKFIPEHYLYNDIATRLSLLQGLMDTDGDCSQDGNSFRARFGTISPHLAKGVKELVQSLGGLCSITEQHGMYKGRPHLSYRCAVRLPNFNPFKLRSKAENYPFKYDRLKRTIVDIQLIDTRDDARCLTLEADDGLFLTTNCVVTHNTGKSVLALNIGSHIAEKINVPVLYLDTEMMKEDQTNRMMAMLTETAINDIETGKFGQMVKADEVIAIARKFEEANTPFYYKNISGKPFEDILAIMRRWLIKKVGLNDDGKAKPCVIIFDYLKLMSDDGLMNLQEYQLLGFMMTGLHNFAVRYKLPVLSFMQLNRDGINKESTDVASGSDRIIWLCSNFSIYKKKSDEEMAKSGKDSGNRKMVPIVARHGGDWNDGDYINMHMQGQFAKIVEGRTAYEEDADEDEDGFIIEEGGEDDIPFQ